MCRFSLGLLVSPLTRLRSRSLAVAALRTWPTSRAMNRWKASNFFADGMASRPPVEGTVARGHLRTDTVFFEGKQSENSSRRKYSTARRAPKSSTSGGRREQVAKQLLERGQQRFDIFCARATAEPGRGTAWSSSAVFPRLRRFTSIGCASRPIGHFFDVATRGFGRMNSYAAQVPPADRWAIVGLHPRPAIEPARRGERTPGRGTAKTAR